MACPFRKSFGIVEKRESNPMKRIFLIGCLLLDPVCGSAGPSLRGNGNIVVHRKRFAVKKPFLLHKFLKKNMTFTE